MFTTLYDTILPFIGEFFGKITAFASLSIRDFLDMLNSNFSLFTYTNLFTGQTGSHSIYIVDAVKVLISPIRWLMTAIFSIEGIPLTTPLWAALLLVTILVVIILGFIKFLLSIV